MPDNTTCEIKLREGWSEICISLALMLHRERLLRCPECKGQVRAHQQSADGTVRAHFEHLKGHKGCSRGHYFDGTRSPHPRPVT